MAAVPKTAVLRSGAWALRLEGEQLWVGHRLMAVLQTAVVKL